MTFTIYFELYGKKMKTDIEAFSREDAINRLKNKIIIHRVDQEIAEGDNDVEILKSILGMK